MRAQRLHFSSLVLPPCGRAFYNLQAQSSIVSHVPTAMCYLGGRVVVCLTDSIPGGADILNEAITDSLLQERYRRMLGVARGVDPSGGGGGGDASDDMGERRPST